MKTIAWINAVLVGILLAPRTGMSAESSAWQLRFRDGAGGVLENRPAQISKTNGIGTLDLVWGRTFAVQSNRNYLLRLPYRTEDASLGNLLLLRYTHGTNETPRLDDLVLMIQGK